MSRLCDTMNSTLQMSRLCDAMNSTLQMSQLCDTMNSTLQMSRLCDAMNSALLDEPGEVIKDTNDCKGTQQAYKNTEKCHLTMKIKDMSWRASRSGSHL